MPRRQPISNKQKKAELQLKRARKREVSPSHLPEGNKAQTLPSRAKQNRSINRKSVLKPSSKPLESSFVKVHPHFLEATKLLASVTPLPRPLPSDAAILSESDIVCSSDDTVLRCPERPKWRYDMSKKQVEANEEGLFRLWLTETDTRISRWKFTGEKHVPTVSDVSTDQERSAKNLSHDRDAPVYYERNLQVWRQLWRVTEISHILLVLLDSRCPAIHLPPSLQHFLSSLTPPRPLIFVLTKTDMVPNSYVSAWTTWLQTKFSKALVVSVRSYRTTNVTSVSDEFLSKSKYKHEPCIGDDDFSRLVFAVQKSYEDLIMPPEKIRHDPQKVENWKTTRDFPTDLHWDNVKSRNLRKEGKVSEKKLTIGLIGQPNVGKSSLLNALFGTHKVKASRTPGKTKHFQTLFWTSEIRLVDCPGLVFPNFVRMELQVLSGILPISQIPSIPACMYYVLRLMELEDILRLERQTELPSTSLDQDKRTWREPQPVQPKPSISQWTTMDVLTAFAVKKSWVTAKAGRPDINRAGNYILRSLAEGKIKWAFWPPGIPDSPVTGHDESGIWLGGTLEDENWSETTEDVEFISDGELDSSSAITDDDTFEEELAGTSTLGRFQALTLDNNSGNESS